MKVLRERWFTRDEASLEHSSSKFWAFTARRAAAIVFGADASIERVLVELLGDERQPMRVRLFGAGGSRVSDDASERADQAMLRLAPEALSIEVYT